MSTDRVYWLGFGVAASRLLRLDQAPAMALARLVECAPDPVPYGAFDGATLRESMVAPNALKIYMVRVREALADIGSPAKVETIRKPQNEPGGAYRLSAEHAQAVRALIEAAA